MTRASQTKGFLYCPQHLVIGLYFRLDREFMLKMCDFQEYRSMIRNLGRLLETNCWSSRDMLLGIRGAHRVDGHLFPTEEQNKCLAAGICGGQVGDNDGLLFSSQMKIRPR